MCATRNGTSNLEDRKSEEDSNLGVYCRYPKDAIGNNGIPNWI